MRIFSSSYWSGSESRSRPVFISRSKPRCTVWPCFWFKRFSDPVWFFFSYGDCSFPPLPSQPTHFGQGFYGWLTPSQSAVDAVGTMRQYVWTEGCISSPMCVYPNGRRDSRSKTIAGICIVLFRLCICRLCVWLDVHLDLSAVHWGLMFLGAG